MSSEIPKPEVDKKESTEQKPTTPPQENSSPGFNWQKAIDDQRIRDGAAINGSYPNIGD